jgi:hypothetical protein
MLLPENKVTLTSISYFRLSLPVELNNSVCCIINYSVNEVLLQAVQLACRLHKRCIRSCMPKATLSLAVALSRWKERARWWHTSWMDTPALLLPHQVQAPLVKSQARYMGTLVPGSLCRVDSAWTSCHWALVSWYFVSAALPTWCQKYLRNVNIMLITRRVFKF